MGDDGCAGRDERILLRYVRAPSVVDHALHALVALAAAPTGERLKIREVCEPHGLSRKFVAAALNDLRIAEVVTSRRGSRGGYRLARPPEEITVAEVFDAVDVRTPTAAPSFAGTLDLWARAEVEVRAAFDAVTVADLAAEAAEAALAAPVEGSVRRPGIKPL